MTDRKNEKLEQDNAQLDDQQLDGASGGSFSELQGITTKVDVIEHRDKEDETAGRRKSS